MNKSITRHQNYNAADYAYLAAKGYTNKEIVRMWDTEAKAGKPACTWNTFGAKLKLNATLRAAG